MNFQIFLEICCSSYILFLETVWSIDTSTNAGWSNAPSSVLWSHGTYFTLTALGGYAYALGGYINPGSNSNDEYSRREMERYDPNANQWTAVAYYPHQIYNHCACADEETGRIYSSGGIHKYPGHNSDRAEVYYYQVGVGNYPNLHSDRTRSTVSR